MGRSIMKKLWIPMLLIMFLLTGCSSSEKTPQKLKYEDVQTITIKMTEKEPAIKTLKNTVEEAQEFDAVIDFINNMEKEPTEQKEEKNWQFVVELKGKKNHTVTLVEDKIKYDKTWYKTNPMYAEELEKLFKNLKAKAVHEK